jgi:hypothetical protein
MWPAAFLLLGIAVFESYRHLSTPMRSYGGEDSILREGLGEEGKVVGGRWKMPPMMLEIMAVGFIALGWKLWPTDTGEEEEEPHED